MYTVLVIDDEPKVRTSVRRLLTLHGFSIVEAGNAEEALAVLRASRVPDAVTLDYNLPDMLGDELLTRIKELHPRLPVVSLSAHFDGPLTARLEKAGSAACVAKADMATLLVPVVMRLLAAQGAPAPRR